MEFVRMERLAKRIHERRAGRGIRAVAADVGVSSATLSRVENGGIPDLETFAKICNWLGEDPAVYLGVAQTPKVAAPTARVHFKKGVTIKEDSAKALATMILAVQQSLREEDE